VKRRSALFRLPYIGIGLFASLAAAAAFSLDRMDSLPAVMLVAPGYLVQAWLFQRHLALGGLGYDVTVSGVSALVWTAIILGVGAGVRGVVRTAFHRQTLDAEP
jgi:hypothetical protein